MPYRRKLVVLDKAHAVLVDCAAIPKDEGIALNKRVEEIAKMIQGLIRKIKRDLGDEDLPV